MNESELYGGEDDFASMFDSFFLKKKKKKKKSNIFSLG